MITAIGVTLAIATVCLLVKVALELADHRRKPVAHTVTTLDVYQLPGEDPDDFARRVVNLLHIDTRWHDADDAALHDLLDNPHD